MRGTILINPEECIDCKACEEECASIHQESCLVVDLCVGCRSCIIVCPYGVLKLKKNGKGIVKCDLCIERLDRMEKPACVEACPTDALTFKSVGSGSEQDEKDR